MDCKTHLLNRLNRLFLIDSDGFFFENEKYPFSQLDEFLKEIKKVSGYKINVGFVLDDSNESENESESGSDQQSESSNKEEGGASENSSGTDSEKSSDEMEETSYPCTACENVYKNPIRLVRHMENVHMKLGKEGGSASQRDPLLKTHPCSNCGCQFSTRSNMLRHRRRKHIYSSRKTDH
jgi:DNA-directed RNA polymerase subunit M/transcription elongation factor TFIIS